MTSSNLVRSPPLLNRKPRSEPAIVTIFSPSVARRCERGRVAGGGDQAAGAVAPVDDEVVRAIRHQRQREGAAPVVPSPVRLVFHFIRIGTRGSLHPTCSTPRTSRRHSGPVP